MLNKAGGVVTLEEARRLKLLEDTFLAEDLTRREPRQIIVKEDWLLV